MAGLAPRMKPKEFVAKGGVGPPIGEAKGDHTNHKGCRQA
jgi:hypothetical protein